MAKSKVFINGKFYDQDKARISVFDRSFLYGDAAFETMRGYAGRVFRLDRHLERLLKSLQVIYIRHKYTKKYLKDAVYRILKMNGLKSAYIRLVVTRGEGRFGIGYMDEFDPNLIIVAKHFDGYPDRILLKGISAGIAGVQNEYSPLSRIKTANYLNLILARSDAKRAGFDEAILTNTKGSITEGATSNIFLVRSGALVTPSVDSGVLPGIARGVIIEIAGKLKIPVRERAVSRGELLRADEVFFTNSLAEVLPVTRIESMPIGQGVVGPVTKLFQISYQKRVILEVLR